MAASGEDGEDDDDEQEGSGQEEQAAEQQEEEDEDQDGGEEAGVLLSSGASAALTARPSGSAAAAAAMDEGARSSTLSVATKASPMAGTGLAAPAKRKASQDLSGSVGSAADKSESAAGAVGEKTAKKRARPELEVKDEGHRMEGKAMKLRLTDLHFHYCSLMCSLLALH